MVFLTLKLINSLPYALKIDREVVIVKRELLNALKAAKRFLPFYYSLQQSKKLTAERRTTYSIHKTAEHLLVL